MRDKVANLEVVLQTKSDDLAKIQTELVSARDRAASLDVAALSQSSEIAMLGNELVVAEARRAQLQADRDAHSAELRAIKRSSSWRLTAPLRRAAERVPALIQLTKRFLRAIVWIFKRFRDRADVHLIRQSGIFDGEWYLERNPDVRAARIDPASHYLRYGAWEGRNPSSRFDSAWYLFQYPDVAIAGANPLVHYLRHGAREGREAKIARTEISEPQSADVELILQSGFFDGEWYLAQYPDVRAARSNPALHYLLCGAREGRNPSVRFDTAWYLSQYPDVAADGMNPLLHYLRFGVTERRDPINGSDPRLCDAGKSWWETNPFRRMAVRVLWLPRFPGILPPLSWCSPLQLGSKLRAFWKRRQSIKLITSSVLFDQAWYRHQNPDVQGSDDDLAAHYLIFGGAEGRDPSPLFDSDWYFAENPDVQAAGVNPLVHYLCFGAAEGRDPRPLANPAPISKRQDRGQWPLTTRVLSGERIRVIAVSHNLNHEGAPNSQLELIAGLFHRGVIEPIVLSPHDGPLRSAYAAAGVPIQLLFPPDLRDHKVFEESVRAMASAFRECGAEVVYANTLQTFWAIAVAERAGLPAIWNVRESEPWQSYFDFLAPEVRTVPYNLFGYPHRVVFVSDATRWAWEPVRSCENFITVHNGLNLERLRQRVGFQDRRSARMKLQISEGELVVVLIGTVCERKGQLDLVRALRLLPNAVISQVRVFIVGDRASDYSKQLHEEIKGLPSDRFARVVVVPETDTPYVYFNAADIALCCSRIESYPRVTLEAMAFDLPIVTTPVFGIAEQVQDGVNALFYEPGDAATLARHIVRLIIDDDLRRQMSSCSRRVLDSLMNYDEMLETYGRLFVELRRADRAAAT